MLDAPIQTPDWLLQMEVILEALNEGVVIVDNQLRVVFANEAVPFVVKGDLVEL